MSLFRIATAPLDWAMDAQTSLGAVFRISTVVTGLTGTIAAPFVVIGMMNARDKQALQMNAKHLLIKREVLRHRWEQL